MSKATETQLGPIANVRALVKKLIEDNAQGGEITLDEFAKQVPNATRTDCVEVLKRATNGLFITGRRGHKSRWVYGVKAKDMQRPAAPARQRESSVASIANQFGSMELRVSVGGQVTHIPVRVELAHAA